MYTNCHQKSDFCSVERLLSLRAIWYTQVQTIWQTVTAPIVGLQNNAEQTEPSTVMIIDDDLLFRKSFYKFTYKPTASNFPVRRIF